MPDNNPFVIPFDRTNKPKRQNPFLLKLESAKAEDAANEAVETGAMEQQLNAPLDVTQDLDNFGDRRAINNPGLKLIEDKARVLQERRPQDEVRIVQDARGQDQLVIKQEGADSFTPVDISGGSIKGEFGDLAGGLLSFEGLLSTAASFLPGGPVVRAGKTAIAAGGGNLIDTAIQKLQGNDSRTPEQVATDAGVSVAVGGAAEGVSSGLQGFFNFALNRGSANPSVRALQDSVRDTNRVIESDPALLEATAGQQGNRAVGALESQSERLSNVIPAYKLQQNQGLEASLQGRAGAQDYAQLDDVALSRIVNNGRFEAQREIADDLRIGDTSADQGGRNLQQGLFDREDPTSYISTSTVNIDRQFQQALEHAEGQEIAFDLRPARKLIAEFEKGNPLPGGVNAAPELTGDLLEVVSVLKGVEGEAIPNTFQLGEESFSGLDALRKLRTRLNSYFSDETLRGTVEEGQARQLRNAISEMIENPIGGDSKFVSQLAKANKAYKEQRETLELDFIRQIAKQDEPGKLVDWLIASERPQNTVQTLKRLVPAGRWNQIQDSVVSDLVNNPQRINGALDAVGRDPRTRTVLLDPRQQELLGQYAQQVSRIDGGQLSSMMEDQAALGDRALQVITQGTPTDINLLKEEGVDIAGSFLNKLIQDSTETVEGRTFVDPGKFSDLVDEAFGSAKASENLTDLFDPETIKFIKDRGKVASLYNGMANGGGAGLQINSIVASLTSNPKDAAQGVLRIRAYGLLGNLLTSKPFLNYMQLAKEPFDSQLVRTGIVVSSVLGGQVARGEQE